MHKMRKGMVLMEHKTCNKCKREKAYYEFYRDEDNYCIDCIKKDEEIRRIIEKEG